MTGARVFVAVVFLLLGASFLASTGLLIDEFQRTEWEAMVVAHSHLFFFYPVFGILALAAYYLPAVVFTDLYWRHVPYGKLRFLVGTLVVAALSVYLATRLDAKPRAFWEVSPAALAEDKGEPANCTGEQCRRASALNALKDLRAKGRGRHGLSKFGRNCKEDTLLEEPDEMTKRRYCFAAGRNLDGKSCCAAQVLLSQQVDRLQETRPSLSGIYDRMLFLPLKIFFILTVVVIAAMLAVWRSRISDYYGDLVPRIERGVLIGGFAMLFWPIMDYGYQQTTNVLFGRHEALQLRYSLVIVPWAVFLLFYFLRRLSKRNEMIGQIAGVVTAAVAVLRYEDLNDWAVRLLGVGSNEWIMGGLLVLAVVGFVALMRPVRASPGLPGSAPVQERGS